MAFIISTAAVKTLISPPNSQGKLTALGQWTINYHHHYLYLKIVIWSGGKQTKPAECSMIQWSRQSCPSQLQGRLAERKEELNNDYCDRYLQIIFHQNKPYS